MNKKNQIIMSAASVSAALAAITSVSEQKQVLDGPTMTAFDASALEAINTAKSQAAVRAAFPQIARTIRLDAPLGRAVYAEIAQAAGDPSPGEGGSETPVDEGDEGAEEEPVIEYDENGIPLNLIETFEQQGEDEDTSALQGLTNQELVEALGIQVPEGVTPEEFLVTLETLYAEIFSIPDTVFNDTPGDLIAAGGSSLIDSTHVGDTFFSCYNNCHSACHGSRGWR